MRKSICLPHSLCFSASRTATLEMDFVLVLLPIVYFLSLLNIKENCTLFLKLIKSSLKFDLNLKIVYFLWLSVLPSVAEFIRRYTFKTTFSDL